MQKKPGGLVLGELACGFGNIVGGGIGGLLTGIQDLTHDSFDILRDLGRITGSIFRLDLPGFVKNVTPLILDIVDIGTDAFRFTIGRYIVGGIVRKFKRSGLMRFVEGLVELHFVDEVERNTVRNNIGLEGRRFGFRLPSQHRVFMMDSGDVELHQMHKDGELDLYAMAGLLSFDSFSLSQDNPNTVVRSVGPDGTDNSWPVSRWTISKHLESNGTEKHLRVYAMSQPIAAQNLDTATRKFDENGVILEWNDRTNFTRLRDNAIQPITKELSFNAVDQSIYDFDVNLTSELLERSEYYDRAPDVYCDLVVLGAFKLNDDGEIASGKTVGLVIAECDKFPVDCKTVGRTDRCCVTIDRNRGSGVIYQDKFPSDIRQYVLTHEIGHYLGLCHCDHTIDNPMWKPFWMSEAGLIGWGTFGYFWNSEPTFSLKDAKNSWRFIIEEMRACLLGEPEIRRPIPRQPVTRPPRPAVNAPPDPIDPKPIQ